MDYHGDGCEHHAKQEDRETFDCLKEIKKLVKAKLALPPLEEMRMTFLGKNCHPWRNFDFERPGEKMYSSSSPEVLSLAKDGSLKNLKKLISKDGVGSALVKTQDGQTILHFAASGGYTRVCTFLICDHQFDVNAKDSMGRTPLHEAASGSHFDTLRELIYYGADLNAQTSMGLTALHFAVEEGNLRAISYLISQGIDVNATSDFGTPLWIAAIQNQQVAMQKLLCFNAKPNIYPDGMLSPLHASILNRSPECVDALLFAGADTNIRSCGVSPLEAAIKCGDKMIVELLLNKGAIPNVMDDNGLTPLEFAAVEKSHEMVKKLFRMTTNIPTIRDWSVSGVITHCESEEIVKRIRRKAEEVYSLYKSVGQKAYEAGKYHTSFVWYTKEAAARLEEIQNYNDSELNLPSFEEIRMLIRAKMAVFRSSNLNPEIPDRCTAEMILEAVGHGDIKKLRRLISKLGSKRVNLLLNVKSAFGETILHFAAGRGHTHICQYILLKLKFDINIKDYRGFTPLHTAAIANKTKTISYLIDRDADLNAMAFTGQTALHLAVEAGSLDVISLLISKGSDVNAATDFGIPLRSAAIHNEEKAMLILLSNGAKPNEFPEGTNSPLCDAIINQSYNCITQLISAEADPNIKSFEVSPLEIAIIYGDIKIIELLLDQGANTNEKGVYGLMPLELAVLEGDEEMVEMLFLKTLPIPNIKDWSVNGVRKHYEDKKAREQVRLKGKSAYSLFNSKGQEAYKAGRYQEANAWFTEAIDTNECDQACVYLKRSLCFLQLNQNNSAVDDALMCLYLEGESSESAAAMCACGLAMTLCKVPLGTCRALHHTRTFLDVCAGIMFTKGVMSCLKYIEAVPWSEEEEEKLRSLFARFNFDDATTRDILARLYSHDPAESQQNLATHLVWSIINGSNSNARNELKLLVKGLLSKSSVYVKDQPELSKEDLYIACQYCLGSLFTLFEEASDITACDKSEKNDTCKPLIECITRQVDNINWLLEILLDQQMADEFVDMWADQRELTQMHERSSPMVRYEVSRVSASLFIAIGTRRLHCRSQVRMGLLQSWFGPMLLDFGWLQRCRKGLDMKALEEAMGQVLLTLPLKQQHFLFMEWFRCFSKHGSECPNLSKAFQIWWRRASSRGSETYAAESR